MILTLHRTGALTSVPRGSFVITKNRSFVSFNPLETRERSPLYFNPTEIRTPDPNPKSLLSLSLLFLYFGCWDCLKES